MKINISNIIKTDGASIDVEFNESLDHLNEIIDDFKFIEDASFNGSVVNKSGIHTLQGNLKTSYTTKCFRCLKDVVRTIDIYVKEDFYNGDDNTDTENYTFEKYHLETDDAIKDNLLLNLPMQTACSKDCKGLCFTCGADLNNGICGCKANETNFKMEALKDFFKS